MNEDKPTPRQLFMAEMCGTGLLLLIGLSSVIFMFAESSPFVALVPSLTLHRIINGFFFGSVGATIALSLIGRISGAHINPIVTMGFWLVGKLFRRRLRAQRKHGPDLLWSICGPSPMILLVLAAFSANVASGQEMEPRTYSPAPVGTQFLILSYGYQSGDVLLDSSLPLQDVSVSVNSGSVGYGRTISLAGRQTNVAVLFPYIRGTAKGSVFENQVAVRRSGGGDVRVRFSTILKGGKALPPKEFAARKPEALIGASVLIVVPTGQYDPQRLVNPGTNRWALKPEIGISKPLNRWTFEVMGGAWFFTANNSFLGESRREQKPMVSFQGAVIYTLRRRMWVSGNATFYTGGSTVLNGTTNDDPQRNSRVGATYSLPLTQRQSLKVAWAKGVTTRIGGSLNTIVIGWQYAWFK